MTVEELIEELQQYDGQMDVCIITSTEDTLMEISDIHVAEDMCVIEG